MNNNKEIRNNKEKNTYEKPRGKRRTSTFLTPGLDNTRLFISFTAGAGTRCMSPLSPPPSQRYPPPAIKNRYLTARGGPCPSSWSPI